MSTILIPVILALLSIVYIVLARIVCMVKKNNASATGKGIG